MLALPCAASKLTLNPAVPGKCSIELVAASLWLITTINRVGRGIATIPTADFLEQCTANRRKADRATRYTLRCLRFLARFYFFPEINHSGIRGIKIAAVNNHSHLKKNGLMLVANSILFTFFTK